MHSRSFEINVFRSLRPGVLIIQSSQKNDEFPACTGRVEVSKRNTILKKKIRFGNQEELQDLFSSNLVIPIINLNNPTGEDKNVTNLWDNLLEMPHQQ